MYFPLTKMLWLVFFASVTATPDIQTPERMVANAAASISAKTAAFVADITNASRERGH